MLGEPLRRPLPRRSTSVCGLWRTATATKTTFIAIRLRFLAIKCSHQAVVDEEEEEAQEAEGSVEPRLQVRAPLRNCLIDNAF